ncbi:lipopolysaccharide biosynthesis protein [Bizionia paragorgiae]|uniref:Membrane protein involved in the export of O-antigen and teichoic acid n=1 Tax=Bizionia paragorgiae TaxID=283786 RepID=A0A1H4BBU9_BIZPA|nr:oligosaccharide flippase family protein [Bizionia paragorgiae]SEA45620.1 Membrane protein involved in the export of O-antigen and teichoic acid [Bizionia paragorgiae]
MKEFLKSFFSFGLAATIEKLIAFLLLPIYTRYFTKEEFGVIDLVQVILGLASIFAVFQLETALQRYYYEYKGKIKEVYISTIFIVIVTLSLVVTLLLFLNAELLTILVFKSAEYVDVVKLAIWQLPFINFAMLSFVILRYEKRNIQFVSLILLKVVVNLLFIFLFVVILKLGIIGVFYAQLISHAISSIFLFMAVRRFLSFSFSRKLFRKCVKYALPQFPARIGSVLLTYGNRFFMIGYLTLGAIGIYSLSLKLASSVQLVYSAFVMAWAPFMFEKIKNPNHKKIFPKVLLLVESPVFLLVSFVCIFSKEIVNLIASNEFQESYQYVGGLSLYFSLFIFKEIVDIGPKYKEKTKYLSLTFFLSVCINLICLFVFIKPFGLYGVVYSMLITNTFLVFCSWYISNRLHYIPFDLFRFILLAIPVYILGVGSMFYYPGFLFRICLFLLVASVYLLAFFFSYKKFKTVE